jgi:hypothetical protein
VIVRDQQRLNPFAQLRVVSAGAGEKRNARIRRRFAHRFPEDLLDLVGIQRHAIL